MMQWDDLSALPPEAKDQVVAIGNFDGVHLGHQAVLTAAARQAREMNTGLAVLTFSPSPRAFFNPEAPPSLLTPMAARVRFLKQMNVQHVYVKAFDEAFSKMLDADFIEKFLVAKLGVRHIVVGENFHFGHRRTGDVNFLVEQSKKYHYGVTPVPPARTTTGTAYSSTLVRERLQAGDPEGARQLLGRPFELEGLVLKGGQQARDWGFPTANMELGPYLRPKYGVYAVKVGIMQGGITQWHPGVANFGTRPTFQGGTELLESHLFDFDQDLYDKTIRVQLWHYLRPEQKFGKIEALRQQIAEDARQARAKFGA